MIPVEVFVYVCFLGALGWCLFFVASYLGNKMHAEALELFRLAKEGNDGWADAIKLASEINAKKKTENSVTISMN
jgi:hypothetical protein